MFVWAAINFYSNFSFALFLARKSNKHDIETSVNINIKRELLYLRVLSIYHIVKSLFLILYPFKKL